MTSLTYAMKGRGCELAALVNARVSTSSILPSGALKLKAQRRIAQLIRIDRSATLEPTHMLKERGRQVMNEIYRIVEGGLKLTVVQNQIENDPFG